MKPFWFLLFFLFAGCSKKDSSDKPCDTELIITKTQSPLIADKATGIVFSYDCYGPNMCYRFSTTAILEKPGNIYEIRAIGTISCKAAVCLQAIYKARDTVTIYTTAAGTYYLQFFNNNVISKTDTVRVN